MQLTFRPITTWPGARAKRHVRSQFKANYQDTLYKLEYELWHLAAKNVALEVDVSENDIRMDGRLREDRQPRSVGIILNFESKHGPLRFASDTYDNWRHNLRAIALTLESLRAVERYGVVKKGEQFVGWKALPSSIEIRMTPAEAAACLVTTGGGDTQRILTSVDSFVQSYRRACLNTHPDHHPELTEEFKRVQRAKVVLEAHFAGAAS